MDPVGRAQCCEIGIRRRHGVGDDQSPAAASNGFCSRGPGILTEEIVECLCLTQHGLCDCRITGKDIGGFSEIGIQVIQRPGGNRASGHAQVELPFSTPHCPQIQALINIVAGCFRVKVMF